MKWTASVALWLVLSPTLARGADDALWGHWPLRQDFRDQSGRGHHAAPSRADLVPDPAQGTAFNGQGDALQIPASDLNLGAGDFTVSLWAHTAENLRDDLGDLVSLWNPATRTGWQLTLRNNTGVTSSQAGWRQLQFGVDAGTTPAWRDEGQPGQSLLGFALCAHDGALYVSTCEPGRDQAGRVYRYDGPGRWTDLGKLDGANSVTTLAAFQGRLYAGTGKYRLGGSSLPESENPQLGGRIYRFSPPAKWELVGELPETEAVKALTVFDGRLYASSLYRPAGFFRYEADGRWTALPVPDGKRVEPLAVFNGALYAGSYDGGRVYRFNGESWADLGQLGDNTQTYSFAAYQGRLHVGTWPSGKVYRLDPGDAWADTGRLGEELEVMGMLTHNGSLYAGTLPLGQVYRHDGDQKWSLARRLDETPDVKYRRVWTMAQFQGRLFCTTLPSGKIWSLSAGSCVTYDRELPPGWRHIVAQRAGQSLRLFVDGQLAAETAAGAAEPLNLSPGDAALRIGAGSVDTFNGRLRDVRLHRRALSPAEIRDLAAAR